MEEDIVTQSKVEEKIGSRRSESEKRSGKNRYEPYIGPSGREARYKFKNVRADHRFANRDSGSSSSRFRKDRGERNRDANTNARIGDYNFNVSTSELVTVLRSMGDKGYLTELFSEKGKQAYMKNRQEPPKPPSPKGTVNVINGGVEVNGVTYTVAKKTTKFTVTHGKRTHPTLEDGNITFDDADSNGLMIPHNDALVISLVIHDTNIKRFLIDPGSSVNIILLRVVNEMLMGDRVVPKARSLSGFDNSTVITKGEIELSTYAEGVIKETKFQVIDTDMAYNVILGRPWIHDMDVVPSTLHQVIKFPSKWGVQQIRGDQKASKSINSVKQPSQKDTSASQKDAGTSEKDTVNQILIEIVSKQTDVDSRPDVIQEPEENENIKIMIEELEAVPLFEQWPDRIIHIGARLNPDRRDPSFIPVKQKKRKQGSFKNKVIDEEVQKLLKNDSIREVKYRNWLANTVVVPKKNSKWRVCVDYTDLNKACRKDSFPLSHIDQLIDATAGHELLSFLDAYSGYNQIKMDPLDEEKTSFITNRGTYYYKVMPFGLKIVGATYQRLVTKMFHEHLGKTMEVNIDDMLVKSTQAEDHFQHLSTTFEILRRYNMKLNPEKCAFGVASGKFLGFLISNRGIEVNLAQIKAIKEIPDIFISKKEVQRLTGRIAALGRFISRSSEKSVKFFSVLKKQNQFEWTKECRQSLKDLKAYLTNPPLLSKPRDGERLFVYLAVAEVDISAVLVREDKDAETRYPHLEKLALALVMAARKLRPYFQCHPISVITACPLRNILHKQESSGRLANWAIEISEYDIIYQPRTAIKSQVLADFVADFNTKIIPEVEKELQFFTGANPGTWTLFTDGSSNVKGAGLGIILIPPSGESIRQAIKYYPITNNEAEYEAVITGLEIARELSIEQIMIKNDSQLVVNQMQGTYTTREARMQQYLEKARELVRQFQSWKIVQIPREENAEADTLANLASVAEVTSE
ncbi:uncharacterized protein LOC142169585 [Nicotiana tabacum]|uniref:Uncharacterized protein LOC142169585 n=1 Tax=Nicotiana tabacum TaxID=4097 RepID=A0AC58SRH7_TOBAC